MLFPWARLSAGRALHTSAPARAAPRTPPRPKLKTHTGTAKRIAPIRGSAAGAGQLKFKRSHANKQHLNSSMPRARLARLGEIGIVRSGPVSRMLRRLLAPRI